MKNKLLSFTLLTAFAAVLLSGCKPSDTTPTCDENVFVGNYGGQYSIFSLINVDDSLFATNAVAGDGKIQIKSRVLGVTFEASPIESNCNKANIASIISDSLFINDSIYVKSLNATGTGTLSGNTLSVHLVFISGTLKSKYVTLPLSTLNNQNLSGTYIDGTFTK